MSNGDDEFGEIDEEYAALLVSSSSLDAIEDLTGSTASSAPKSLLERYRGDRGRTSLAVTDLISAQWCQV